MIWATPNPAALTEVERDLGCWVITGDELEVGDLLVLLGLSVRVDKLPDYRPQPASADDPIGVPSAAQPGTRVAHGNGRALLVVEPDDLLRILPRPDTGD